MKLEVSDLEKVYQSAKGETRALLPTSFEVTKGEFVSLVGPSGCGKTTTLYMIVGLEEPSGGTIRLDGVEVRGPGADRGMVFQNYTLFPWLTVLQNACFSHNLAGNIDLSQTTSEIQSHIGRAHSLLNLMGLNAFANSYPKELSGGMKQRVAIARALANRPKLLLMDEPFGALDAQTREEMQEMLLLLCEHDSTTTLFVTHDVEEAIYLSTRILVFSSRPGQILRDIKVPFGAGYERTREIKVSPEFIALKREILELLHSNAPTEGRSDLLRRLVGGAR